ncbi:MAG: carboxypeptidase-like regulatory domain-containing protein, partial [Vicinamibacterales bacterium]|nr:carboxypeptidase-like regulatory domain-containing protein [Vicinamibacterales bacterium]
NVAPLGSRLVVTDLTASLVLPPGRDQVVGSADDPLRMAQRAAGAWEQVQPVHQPGPDGKLGTADDVTTLGPGETGSAEYLVEGRREGTHVLEMELAGTLTGLPVGPVPIRGRAAGAVLVRNPTFTLTFTHPDIVNAGEPYTLDVTVTNTSESPANFVTLTLDANNVSGARLVGESSHGFDEIAPSDSVTATFDLIAARTGRITAATLDADENVAGRFQLKTAVGEFGIPLSPDSLVLPREANALPKELREAALGLLGRAWAVATAPAAAVPPDLQRFSKQVVFDHAIEVAEAGFRYSLGEPLADSALHLLADFAGSNYVRLAERVTKPEDLPFLQDDYEGFDLLRRRSFRGDVLAAAIARILADPLQQVGASAFHREVAGPLTSRAPHVSVLVAAASGTLPVELRLIDPNGRQLGGGTAAKITKEIPFGEYLAFADASGTPTAAMALVATPEAGVFTARLVRRAGVADDARFDVSVVVPTADGRLQVASFEDIALTDLPSLGQPESAPYRVVFEVVAEGAPAPTPVSRSLADVPDPAPSVLAVVQMADADRVGCTERATYQAGRVVAVLFSEEVTPESVQDRLAPEEIAAFSMSGNRAVGVALQPGRRVAYVAMRDPIGPFVPVELTIEGATDRRGQSMGSATKPVLVTVTDEGGVVTGRVLNADGTGAPYADVRLFYEFQCEAGLLEGGGQKTVTVGIAAKNADADGRFGWNYVLRGATRVKLVALDPANPDEFRPVRFAVSRHGQRLEVNLVFLGRGTLRGRTLAEDGTTRLPGTQIRVTSLTDQSQFGAVTDEQGAFEIGRIPVGSILVEAVDTTRPASIFVAEDIPFAGAIVTRDLVLLDVDTTGVVVEYGALTGRVLRRDGLTPVGDVPVIAYYANRSQPGVRCPPPPGGHNEPVECAVAVVRSDASGAFEFPRVVAGALRVYSFDQGALAEGEVRIDLPADGRFDFNLLIGGGLGKVHGVVVDRDGRPVTDARVGGGLTLTAVDADGRFTLVDVPVGRRDIVAVSDAMQSTG